MKVKNIEKENTNMLIYIILGVFIVVFLACVATSWKLSNNILKPKVFENEKLYQREVDEGRLNEKVYQSWSKNDFSIKSRYGYDLSCQLLNNEISQEQIEHREGKMKLAVICHGYTVGKYSSIMYAELFLKRGITVLTYDHRNHGLSGKAFTSMGYYEKFDLQTVIDWCYEEFGTNIAIVTHGESMGAATVLSHLAIDGRVRCTIADCPFSSLKELIKYQIKQYFHLPKIPFIPIANIIIRLRAGFWLDDVEPIKGVVQSNAPILFIHGVDDNYIPCSMSQDMYDAKSDKKEIYLAPNAQHARSYEMNHEEYENVVNKFLDTYYFSI
jgi:fermentation-respiration switch protein FrsA (DUF1100 family)